MDVRDLGEFGLIERLRAMLPASDKDLIVGPGDDAAVWRAGDRFVIATTDTMVAGTHFLPGRVAWRDAGWKALATNVSDIAAMGGTPRFALITLCLPPETDVAAVDELYAGINECAAAHGVTVAGGDIVSSPTFAITTALMGEPQIDAAGEPLLLRRDAAKPGDLVAVTGPLGGSAGGFRALLSGDDSADACALITRHMRPSPRVDAGRAAVASDVRCAIDISDGLLQDIGHICEASSVACELRFDQLAVEERVARVFPDDARMMAATGGEDYELVLVGEAAALRRAGEALGSALSVVGKISDGSGVRVVDAAGRDVDVTSGGWDHLRGGHHA